MSPETPIFTPSFIERMEELHYWTLKQATIVVNGSLTAFYSSIPALKINFETGLADLAMEIENSPNVEANLSTTKSLQRLKSFSESQDWMKPTQLATVQEEYENVLALLV